MAKIVVSENVTLDGVVEDPTGKKVSGTGAGSTASENETAKSGQRPSATRRCAPTPCS